MSPTERRSPKKMAKTATSNSPVCARVNYRQRTEKKTTKKQSWEGRIPPLCFLTYHSLGICQTFRNLLPFLRRWICFCICFLSYVAPTVAGLFCSHLPPWHVFRTPLVFFKPTPQITHTPLFFFFFPHRDEGWDGRQNIVCAKTPPLKGVRALGGEGSRKRALPTSKCHPFCLGAKSRSPRNATTRISLPFYLHVLAWCSYQVHG